MKLTGDPRIDESTAGTVVGSDEAGYGSWAGPLVVAAVATPRNWEDPRVQDSKFFGKQGTAKYRQMVSLYEEFWQKDGFPMAVEVVSPAEIDRLGVWPALVQAHESAIKGTFWRISEVNPLIILDGNVPHEVGIPLPKADKLVPAVSLASIIAKVTHDRLLMVLAGEYPGYGFESNVGYGSPKHQSALSTLGPCPAHRQSYDPVRRARQEKESPEKEWSIFDED